MEATKVLTQNKTRLRDILMTNIDFAVGQALAEKLLVHFEFANLKSIPLPADAAAALVDKMLYRGETTCGAFLRLLQGRKLTDQFPELRTLAWDSGPPSAEPPSSSSARCDAAQTGSPVQGHKKAAGDKVSPPAARPPLSSSRSASASASAAGSGSGSAAGSHFVDRHRRALTQRVTMVAPILDLLLDEGVVTGEHYSTVRSKRTSADQMRALFAVLDGSGPRAKDLFYRGLQENERFLVNDLLLDTAGDVGPSVRAETTRETTSADRAAAVNTFSKISVSPSVLVEGETVSQYRFRFGGAGVFQCRQTGLGFKTTGEGEVLYRIHQWDERRLQSTRRFPAGPLYSVRCPQETLCQLHLPHCDTTPGDLSVAHITDEGLTLSKPQEVTQTHVVVDAGRSSLYGLLKRTENAPIRSQVLLLLRPPGRKRQILGVILVPRNVPVKEVHVHHDEDEHIETTSLCDNLTPNREYSLQCATCKVLPKAATYFLNYGPNYHATFQVTFDIDEDEFTLELLGPDKEVVWKQDIDLAAQPQAPPPFLPSAPPPLLPSAPPHREAASAPARHFVDQHRCSLIQRVTMVESILDILLGERGITQYGYDQVRTKTTSMAKMRELYTYLNCSGPKAKDIFYRSLERHEPMLLESLTSD